MATFNPTQGQTGGFSRFADVIRDEWMVDLSLAELKVLLYIDRKTAGWGKRSVAIPYTYFISGQPGMDRGCGVNRQAVAEAIAVLKGLGLILVVTARNDRGHKCASIYAINYDASPDDLGPRAKALRRAIVARRKAGRSEAALGMQSEPGPEAALGMQSIPQSGPPLGMQNIGPGPVLHTKGSCLEWVPLHTDSHDRHIFHKQQHDESLSGSKGGQASSEGCPTGLPAAPGMLPGVTPGPPHIESVLPGASPQTPEAEGAAAPQEDSCLTAEDHALIEKVAGWMNPTQLARYRALVIQGRQETLAAARLGDSSHPAPLTGAGRGGSRVPFGLTARDPRPPESQRLSPENRPDKPTTFKILPPQALHSATHTPPAQDFHSAASVAMQFEKFARGVSHDSLIGDLCEFGMEREQARQIVTLHGTKVDQWIERASGKRNPAGYVMTLCQIESRKIQDGREAR